MAPRAASRLLCGLAVALTTAGVAPADAAVRMCGGAVAATASAGDELAARKAALDLWKAEAGKRGPGYDAWRLAFNKVFECKPESDGKLTCTASARPCTIEQAPATRELRQK